MVHQDHKAHRVFREFKVYRVAVEFKENLEFKARLVHKVFKEKLDPKEYRAK